MIQLPPEVVTPLNAIMANYPRNSQCYKWAKEAKDALRQFVENQEKEKSS